MPTKKFRTTFIEDLTLHAAKKGFSVTKEIDTHNAGCGYAIKTQDSDNAIRFVFVKASTDKYNMPTERVEIKKDPESFGGFAVRDVLAEDRNHLIQMALK